MKIMYKCSCMNRERAIEVMDRPEGGDIGMWVELVVSGSIAVDHTARSPLCKSDIMEYVKIPVDENAPGIGQKPYLAS